jgi:O-antigen/teichoic acid export membrane protein
MGTTKDTFKHATIYSAAAVLGRMVSFIMLPFYAHILRDIGYGIIGMVDISLSFLMSLLAYGVQSSIIRFYHEEPPANKMRVVSTGMLLVGGATLGLVLLVMLVSRPLSSLLLGSPEHSTYFCLALGAFFFDLTGQGAAAILIIQRRSVLFSLISLLRLCLGLGLNIYLIIILRWGLLGYFLSTLLTSAAVGSLFALIAVLRCGLGFDREVARKLIIFQLPLIPGNLTSFVSRQVERILVRYQIGLSTVGVLEMGYKFPVLLSILIGGPFMRSWNTKRTEIADRPGAPEHIGRVYTYYLFLVVFAGLVLALNMRPVLMLLTPPEFWPAYRIAWIEIVTAILEGSYFHLYFGLYWTKDTRTIALIRAVSSVVKVGLAFLMISLWGFYGAAWSALVSTAILLFWAASKAQARYPLLIEYRKIALMLTAAGALFVILVRADLNSLALTRILRQSIFPDLIRLLERTALETWRNGAVIRILSERTELVAEMVVRTLCALSFLVFFPFVHEESRRGLRRRAARLLRR